MKISKIFTLILPSVVLQNGNNTNIEDTLPVVSDTIITSKIKELFHENIDLSSLRIHVRTRNQIVSLVGTVRTHEERKTAINIAKNIKHVKAVYSNIFTLEDD
jgi:hyperosmotically inducible protein